MEDVESERRISRKKRKLTTQQGVVIGIAAVAGVGLVTKLFSFLRREKSKKLDEADLGTLEAVLSGDAAKSSLPLQTQVALSTPKFANLEDDDDEPDHKAASESSPEDATAETDATRDADATADVDANTKAETPHFNGQANGVKHHTEEEEEAGKHYNNEDGAAELRIEDEGEHHSEGGAARDDAAKIPREDAVKEPLEDADHVQPHLENTQHLSEDHVAAVEAHSNGILEPHSEDAEKLSIEDEGKHNSADIAVEHEVEDAEEEGKYRSEAADSVDIEEKLGSIKLQPNGDASKLLTAENHVTDDEVKQQTEAAAEPQIKDVENLVTEHVGKHPSEDAAEPHIKDAENLIVTELDEGKHPSEDAAEPHIKDAENLIVTELDEGKHPSEDIAVEPAQDAEKIPEGEDRSENSVEPHSADHDAKHHLTELDAEQASVTVS